MTYLINVAGVALTQKQDQSGIGGIGRTMTDAEILAWCKRRWLEQATAGPSEKHDHEARWEQFVDTMAAAAVSDTLARWAER